MSEQPANTPMQRHPSLVMLVALLAAPGTLLAQGPPQGPEFRVNTYTTLAQAAASVASSSTGNFVVVWSSDQDGSVLGIFAQRYASGGAPLGSEFRVNTYTTDMQRNPVVASDSAGNFVVAWASNNQDGNGYGIFAQRFASTGVPLGTEFRVNTSTTSQQRFAAVASSPAGTFVVAWDSLFQDGAGYGIFGQRYATTGVPLGGEFRVNTYTTAHQSGPSVAADSGGNFVVTWNSYTQDGWEWGVFAQRYASTGTPLGGEFRVNTYTTSYQDSPSVVADSAGDFVVAWQSFGQDGANRGAFAQRFAGTGVPLGGEFRVNTYTTNYQGGPSLASDSAGNFVVTWWSDTQDGAGFGIFAQRFANTGTPLGGEFRVNTYTTGSQFFPAVAADSAGNFVVAWQDDTQDGSGFGVYGQRYSMIVPVELVSFTID